MKEVLKRSLALAAVIAWGMLIITTLILAFINDPVCHQAFVCLIYVDIILPVILYIINMFAKLNKRNK